MPPAIRRELIWLAALLGLGVFVLPALVYAVGAELLGEYRPEGGMGLFYRDLYSAVGRGEGWACLLLAGPWLAITVLRILWRPMFRRAPEAFDEA